MSGRFPHGDESRICPGQLGNTAHAALIKSRSGCPPRKQITMIIPNGHPLTALKHPSIKAPFQLFHPLQTKISLLLSVMCHLLPPLCRSPSLSALVPFIAMCQLFAAEAEKDGKLSDLRRHESGAKHTAAAVWATDGIRQKTPSGPLLNFDPTAGQRSGTVVSSRRWSSKSAGKRMKLSPLKHTLGL